MRLWLVGLEYGLFWSRKNQQLIDIGVRPLRIKIRVVSPAFKVISLFSTFRQKEAQSQENVKIQLKSTIQELEAASQLQEEMLREADSQTEHLKKMLRSHKEVLLELQGILLGYEDSSGKKLCGRENVTSLPLDNLRTAFAVVLRDFDSELSHLREKVVLVCAESAAFPSNPLCSGFEKIFLETP